MRRFLTLLLFTFILPAASASAQLNIPEFPGEENWNWAQLEQPAAAHGARPEFLAVKAALTLPEARFLFRQLINLPQPQAILALRDIQSKQQELGGAFFGVIPEQISRDDTLPVPDDFRNLLRCAAFLAGKRQQALEAIAGTGYPLHFEGNHFPELQNAPAPAAMTLELDLSAVEDLAAYFAGNSPSAGRAREIAGEPSFREMLKHRKNLGYIPEPVTDAQGLAWFIRQAAADQPLNNIWKWMNPWNYFNFADFALNLENYRTVIADLAGNREKIENDVLHRIGLFAPPHVEFHDHSGFAVNWGIRGWATARTGGMNLVQFKDNYKFMFRTLIHETYHRLQLKICPVDSSRPDKTPREFEDLFYFGFSRDTDRRFYQALSLIMLEGTASYVGGIDPAVNVREQAAEAMHILRRFYRAVYEDRNFEEAEKLENSGLRSNGPFYQLGYFLTGEIVRSDGGQAVGRLLNKGAPFFFRRCLQIRDLKSSRRLPAELRFPQEIRQKILELAGTMHSRRGEDR